LSFNFAFVVVIADNSSFPALFARLWWQHFVQVGLQVHRAKNPLPDPDSPAYEAYPWVALFLDSHDSHIYDVRVLRDAWDKKVLILNFPGHCTHLLQPLDTGIFTAFQSHFRDSNAWLAVEFRLLNVETHPVSTEYYVYVAENALRKAFTPSTIPAAFRRVGLAPFNPKFAEELAERGKFGAFKSLTGAPVTLPEFVEQKALEVLEDPEQMRRVEILVSPKKKRVPIYELPIAHTPQRQPMYVLTFRIFFGIHLRHIKIHVFMQIHAFNVNPSVEIWSW
jgi:hypothetical protein